VSPSNHERGFHTVWRREGSLCDGERFFVACGFSE
jgi:hypothetical protein